MFGEIAEHDEGECGAVVGLVLGRCADELDKAMLPSRGFKRTVRAGTGPCCGVLGCSRRLGRDS
jgi:hypothetical protein